MKDIAIFGAGGYGREVACMLLKINKLKPVWNFIGFIDDGLEVGHMTEYGPVIGNTEFLNNYQKLLNVVITIGNPIVLKKIVNNITNPNIEYPNLFDPSVEFYDIENIRLGKGNVISTKCLVSCNVDMGDFNLLNLSSFVGHDVKMGSYNVIMPSVNLCGGVELGDCNMFGVKSTVIQYLKVGNNNTIAAGSVVFKDVLDNVTIIGNPGKPILMKK